LVFEAAANGGKRRLPVFAGTMTHAAPRVYHSAVNTANRLLLAVRCGRRELLPT